MFAGEAFTDPTAAAVVDADMLNDDKMAYSDGGRTSGPEFTLHTGWLLGSSVTRFQERLERVVDTWIKMARGHSVTEATLILL